MTTENEVMIARVRMQKDRMVDLVRQLEQKTRLKKDDFAYVESVLKDVENDIKQLRKKIK